MKARCNYKDLIHVLRCDYVFIEYESTKRDETDLKKGHIFCLKYDKKFKLYVATKSQLVASVLVEPLPFLFLNSEIVYSSLHKLSLMICLCTGRETINCCSQHYLR